MSFGYDVLKKIKGFAPTAVVRKRFHTYRVSTTPEQLLLTASRVDYATLKRRVDLCQAYHHASDKHSTPHHGKPNHKDTPKRCQAIIKDRLRKAKLQKAEYQRHLQRAALHSAYVNQTKPVDARDIYGNPVQTHFWTPTKPQAALLHAHPTHRTAFILQFQLPPPTFREGQAGAVRYFRPKQWHSKRFYIKTPQITDGPTPTIADSRAPRICKRPQPLKSGCPAPSTTISITYGTALVPPTASDAITISGHSIVLQHDKFGSLFPDCSQTVSTLAKSAYHAYALRHAPCIPDLTRAELDTIATCKAETHTYADWMAIRPHVPDTPTPDHVRETAKIKPLRPIQHRRLYGLPDITFNRHKLQCTTTLPPYQTSHSIQSVSQFDSTLAPTRRHFLAISDPAPLDLAENYIYNENLTGAQGPCLIHTIAKAYKSIQNKANPFSVFKSAGNYYLSPLVNGHHYLDTGITNPDHYDHGFYQLQEVETEHPFAVGYLAFYHDKSDNTCASNHIESYFASYSSAKIIENLSSQFFKDLPRQHLQTIYAVLENPHFIKREVFITPYFFSFILDPSHAKGCPKPYGSNSVNRWLKDTFIHHPTRVLIQGQGPPSIVFTTTICNNTARPALVKRTMVPLNHAIAQLTFQTYTHTSNSCFRHAANLYMRMQKYVQADDLTTTFRKTINPEGMCLGVTGRDVCLIIARQTRYGLHIHTFGLRAIKPDFYLIPTNLPAPLSLTLHGDEVNRGLKYSHFTTPIQITAPGVGTIVETTALEHNTTKFAINKTLGTPIKARLLALTKQTYYYRSHACFHHAFIMYNKLREFIVAPPISYSFRKVVNPEGLCLAVQGQNVCVVVARQTNMQRYGRYLLSLGPTLLQPDYYLVPTTLNAPHLLTLHGDKEFTKECIASRNFAHKPTNLLSLVDPNPKVAITILTEFAQALPQNSPQLVEYLDSQPPFIGTIQSCLTKAANGLCEPLIVYLIAAQQHKLITVHYTTHTITSFCPLIPYQTPKIEAYSKNCRTLDIHKAHTNAEFSPYVFNPHYPNEAANNKHPQGPPLISESQPLNGCYIKTILTTLAALPLMDQLLDEYLTTHQFNLLRTINAMTKSKPVDYTYVTYVPSTEPRCAKEYLEELIRNCDLTSFFTTTNSTTTICTSCKSRHTQVTPTVFTSLFLTHGIEHALADNKSSITQYCDKCTSSTNHDFYTHRVFGKTTIFYLTHAHPTSTMDLPENIDNLLLHSSAHHSGSKLSGHWTGYNFTLNCNTAYTKHTGNYINLPHNIVIYAQDPEDYDEESPEDLLLTSDSESVDYPPGQLLYKEADLFTSTEECMAHCVATDFGMHGGVALTFRNKFARIDELKAQQPAVGSLAVLTHGTQHLIYLTTKAKTSDKPTYPDIQSSLDAMVDYMYDHQLSTVAIPYIACGIDGCKWEVIEKMICDTLIQSSINVVVYYTKQYPVLHTLLPHITPPVVKVPKHPLAPTISSKPDAVDKYCTSTPQPVHGEYLPLTELPSVTLPASTQGTLTYDLIDSPPTSSLPIHQATLPTKEDLNQRLKQTISTQSANLQLEGNSDLQPTFNTNTAYTATATHTLGPNWRLDIVNAIHTTPDCKPVQSALAIHVATPHPEDPQCMKVTTTAAILALDKTLVELYNSYNALCDHKNPPLEKIDPQSNITWCLTTAHTKRGISLQTTYPFVKYISTKADPLQKGQVAKYAYGLNVNTSTNMFKCIAGISIDKIEKPKPVLDDDGIPIPFTEPLPYYLQQPLHLRPPNHYRPEFKNFLALEQAPPAQQSLEICDLLQDIIDTVHDFPTPTIVDLQMSKPIVTLKTLAAIAKQLCDQNNKPDKEEPSADTTALQLNYEPDSTTSESTPTAVPTQLPALSQPLSAEPTPQLLSTPPASVDKPMSPYIPHATPPVQLFLPEYVVDLPSVLTSKSAEQPIEYSSSESDSDSETEVITNLPTTIQSPSNTSANLTNELSSSDSDSDLETATTNIVPKPTQPTGPTSEPTTHLEQISKNLHQFYKNNTKLVKHLTKFMAIIMALYLVHLVFLVGVPAYLRPLVVVYALYTINAYTPDPYISNATLFKYIFPAYYKLLNYIPLGLIATVANFILATPPTEVMVTLLKSTKLAPTHLSINKYTKILITTLNLLPDQERYYINPDTSALQEQHCTTNVPYIVKHTLLKLLNQHLSFLPTMFILIRYLTMVALVSTINATFTKTMDSQYHTITQYAFSRINIFGRPLCPTLSDYYTTATPADAHFKASSHFSKFCIPIHYTSPVQFKTYEQPTILLLLNPILWPVLLLTYFYPPMLFVANALSYAILPMLILIAWLYSAWFSCACTQTKHCSKHLHKSAVRSIQSSSLSKLMTFTPSTVFCSKHNFHCPATPHIITPHMARLLTTTYNLADCVISDEVETTNAAPTVQFAHYDYTRHTPSTVLEPVSCENHAATVAWFSLLHNLNFKISNYAFVSSYQQDLATLDSDDNLPKPSPDATKEPPPTPAKNHNITLAPNNGKRPNRHAARPNGYLVGSKTFKRQSILLSYPKKYLLDRLKYHNELPSTHLIVAWFIAFVLPTMVILLAMQSNRQLLPMDRYSGVNPTGYMFHDSPPYIHDSPPTGTFFPISYPHPAASVVRTHQGHLYYHYDNSVQTNCTMKYSLIATATTHVCGKTTYVLPAHFSIGSLKVLLIHPDQTRLPFILPASTEVRVCYLTTTNTVNCIPSTMALSNKQFAILSFLVLVALISLIKLYLTFFLVFRQYTATVFILVTITMATMLLSFLAPPLLIVMLIFFAWLWWSNTIVLVHLTILMILIVSWKIALILLVLSLLYFAKCMVTARNIKYTQGGIQFSGSFEQIANETFFINYNVACQLLEHTGSNISDIIALTKTGGPPAKLARAVHECLSTNSSVLYSPSTFSMQSVMTKYLYPGSIPVSTTPIPLGFIYSQSTLGTERATCFQSGPTTITTCRHAVRGPTAFYQNIRCEIAGNTYKIPPTSITITGMVATFQLTNLPPFNRDIITATNDLKTYMDGKTHVILYTKVDNVLFSSIMWPTANGLFASENSDPGDSGSPYMVGNSIVGVHQGRNISSTSPSILASGIKGESPCEGYSDESHTLPNMLYHPNIVLSNMPPNYSAPANETPNPNYKKEDFDALPVEHKTYLNSLAYPLGVADYCLFKSFEKQSRKSALNQAHVIQIVVVALMLLDYFYAIIYDDILNPFTYILLLAVVLQYFITKIAILRTGTYLQAITFQGFIVPLVSHLVNILSYDSTQSILTLQFLVLIVLTYFVVSRMLVDFSRSCLILFLTFTLVAIATETYSIATSIELANLCVTTYVVFASAMLTPVPLYTIFIFFTFYVSAPLYIAVCVFGIIISLKINTQAGRLADRIFSLNMLYEYHSYQNYIIENSGQKPTFYRSLFAFFSTVTTPPSEVKVFRPHVSFTYRVIVQNHDQSVAKILHNASIINDSASSHVIIIYDEPDWRDEIRAVIASENPNIQPLCIGYYDNPINIITNGKYLNHQFVHMPEVILCSQPLTTPLQHLAVAGQASASAMPQSIKNTVLSTPSVREAHAVHTVAEALCLAPTRTMYICRGLPGSGKTTAVKELITKYPTLVVASADDFRVTNGKYVYKPEDTIRVHTLCKKAILDACERGDSCVVDNTNLALTEMKPYVQMADQFNYAIKFITPKTAWATDLSILLDKNTHNVPKEKLQEMFDRFFDPTGQLPDCELLQLIRDSQHPEHLAKIFLQHPVECDLILQSELMLNCEAAEAAYNQAKSNYENDPSTDPAVLKRLRVIMNTARATLDQAIASQRKVEKFLEKQDVLAVTQNLTAGNQAKFVASLRSIYLSTITNLRLKANHLGTGSYSITTNNNTTDKVLVNTPQRMAYVDDTTYTLTINGYTLTISSGVNLQGLAFDQDADPTTYPYIFDIVEQPFKPQANIGYTNNNNKMAYKDGTIICNDQIMAYHTPAGQEPDFVVGSVSWTLSPNKSIIALIPAIHKCATFAQQSVFLGGLPVSEHKAFSPTPFAAHGFSTFVSSSICKTPACRIVHPTYVQLPNTQTDLFTYMHTPVCEHNKFIEKCSTCNVPLNSYTHTPVC